MSEKHVLWVKYTTCFNLNIFLEGCVKGCRSQWQILRNDYDEYNTDKLLFDCFLYVFCQHQFSFTFNHIVGILDNKDLRILKSKYESYFKPFNFKKSSQVIY